MSVGYAVVGDWLVETSAGCTCDGLPHGHMPECGMEPIAKVDDLLDEQLDLRERVEKAERAVKRVEEFLASLFASAESDYHAAGSDVSRVVALRKHGIACDLAKALAEPLPHDDDLPGMWSTSDFT